VTATTPAPRERPASSAQEIGTVANNSDPAPSQSVPAPSQSVPALSEKDTSIAKLAENLIKEKAKLGEWNGKTQRQARSLVATFIE
jgi:hypothetical protein